MSHGAGSGTLQDSRWFCSPARSSPSAWAPSSIRRRYGVQIWREASPPPHSAQTAHLTEASPQQRSRIRTAVRSYVGGTHQHRLAIITISTSPTGLEGSRRWPVVEQRERSSPVTGFASPFLPLPHSPSSSSRREPSLARFRDKSSAALGIATPMDQEPVEERLDDRPWYHGGAVRCCTVFCFCAAPYRTGASLVALCVHPLSLMCIQGFGSEARH